jgi:hypothetical protein
VSGFLHYLLKFSKNFFYPLVHKVEKINPASLPFPGPFNETTARGIQVKAILAPARPHGDFAGNKAQSTGQHLHKPAADKSALCVSPG